MKKRKIQTDKRGPILLILAMFVVLMVTFWGLIYLAGKNLAKEMALANGCYYEGAFRADGESFPASDRCNTCGCSKGKVNCTLIFCEQEYKAFTSGDVINKDSSLAVYKNTEYGYQLFYPSNYTLIEANERWDRLGTAGDESKNIILSDPLDSVSQNGIYLAPIIGGYSQAELETLKSNLLKSRDMEQVTAQKLSIGGIMADKYEIYNKDQVIQFYFLFNVRPEESFVIRVGTHNVTNIKQVQEKIVESLGFD